MKTKFLVVAILLSSCLTGWASFPRSITRQKINQIHIGQTTEADLLRLFGSPTTRSSDLARRISLDWFRSVRMLPTGYLPIVGQFFGGLNLEAQQLSVVLSPDGRVIHWEMHSSKDKQRADGLSMATAHNAEAPH